MRARPSTVRSSRRSTGRETVMTQPTTETSTAHIDPVCGMTVAPQGAAGSYEYAGKTYYFCNPACLQRFRANPEHYVQRDGTQEPAPAKPVPDANSYVCPMHPEIVRREPGACPICGMALEP